MTTSKTIWAVLGAKPGDNAQVLSLAHRLGGSVVVKQLKFTPWHNLPNMMLGTGLGSIQVKDSAIEPPWPDVLIAVGKRGAPISRYVRKASHGKCRTIHLGRPRAPLSDFDLVVTTPQYRLPTAHNVIEMTLPFATAKVLAAAERDHWAATWQHLERPWTIAAIGGQKFPLRLGPTELENFGKALNRQIEKTGGSVILMSSPRSYPQALDYVATRLNCPAWYDLDGSVGNAYFAALSLGDRFAVTGDSVSMIGDMLQTHRPVGVLRLPVSPWRLRWSGVSRWAGPLAKAGLLQPPRDVDGLVQHLFDLGHVHEVGDAARQTRPFIRSEDQLMERIRNFVG